MTPISPNVDMEKKPAPIRAALLQCICAVLLTISIAVPARAELSPLENTELEEVWAASGISIALKNVQIFQFIDSFRYCASDNGYLELQNVKMHNGTGGAALFNYDFGSTTDSGIIYLDVFEPEVASVNDWTGNDPTAITRGMTSTVVPNWDQQVSYYIGSVIFCDPTSTVIATPVDLGAMTIGNIDIPRFSTFTSPRIDGSGFDFQTSFQMTIDKIGYAYNNSCDAIEFCPTYIGGNFTDLPGDDPRYPSSWKPNQATPVDFGDFQIGDLFGDMTTLTPSNPAKIDAGEGDAYGTGTIYGYAEIQLPMQGSIRFENANFNGTDFGPGAIDGIQIQRLNLKLIP